MGSDVLGILTVLVAVIGVGGALARFTHTSTRRLEGEIKELRGELREVELRLGTRIDAVNTGLVETRVAMADRVARIEGRVFGVPLPDTGTASP